MAEPMPPTTAPGAPPARVDGNQLTGRVPDRVSGPYYETWMVIALTIVTIGIWAIVWSYRTGNDLKGYNGSGLGGGLNALLYLVISPVVMFTIPGEIRNAYEGDGRESPVSPMTGLWFLLPLIGHVIWYVKVQAALNDFWVSKGASRS